MAVLRFLTTMLLATAYGALAQSCSSSDIAKLPSNDAFVSRFFICYDDDKLTVGDCFVNATGIDPTCATCFAASSTCVASNCLTACQASPKTPSCVQCAESSCQANLDTCTGTSGFNFDPCQGFFCNQPTWVLPVIIAGSVAGFLILIVALFCIVRRSRNSDSSCLPSCRCCSGRLKDDERIEDRLRRQNQERIERLNRQRDSSTTSAINYGKKHDIGRQVGAEFLSQEVDSFEVGRDLEKDPFDKPKDEYPSLQSRRVTVDKTEHNIRASKLPEGFRIQSIQPGLTPDMIFNMDTVRSMQEANKAAASVPAAVIASHKALKMMGVNENDVQKPYSEPVTARVERIAKAANKQGLMSGGATASLGNQIAEQFAVKRKAAEERAEAFRRAQLEKEEAKIRAEISRENKVELQEKRRTLRESQKLSPEDAKRLSLAAAARRSAKAAGEVASAAGNRLRDFIDKTEKSEVKRV